MTVPIEVRKSGVYKGNGATVEYPFAFKVFNPQTDIAVSMATSDISDESVSRDTFEVFLNADQENNPGGHVRFKTAPAPGKSFVIVSTVPYLQETRLTNHDRFLPEVLNEEHDKLTILCQQLKEQVARCVIVPITSDTTREALLNDILETAKRAGEIADQAAALLAKAEEVGQSTQQAYDGVVSAKKDFDDSLADGIKLLNDIQRLDDTATLEARKALAEINNLVNSTGFSYRYLSNAQANTSYPLTNFDAPQYVKVGDHVLNAEGDLFRVAEVYENTVTLGAKVTSLRGPQGLQGEPGPSGAPGEQGPMGSSPWAAAFGQFRLEGPDLLMDYVGLDIGADFAIEDSTGQLKATLNDNN